MSPFYLISPLILQTIIWPGTRLFLWIFGGLQVKGLKNLSELKKHKNVTRGSNNSGVIFAVNHTSELDPILIPASLPFLSRFMPIFYTSREKNFYANSGKIQQMLYGGIFFKWWGSHAVKIGLQNYEKSLATHITLLEIGKSVVIFPEGGISKTGSVGPAKGGVAYLALHCHSPIVPVAISGTYNLNAKDVFLRRRHMKVQFLKPIIPEHLSIQKTLSGSIDYTRAAQSIMDKISVALKEAAK